MNIRPVKGLSRGRRVLTAAAVSALMVGASGCAGTPWGDTLSGSFPKAQDPPPQGQESAANTPALKDAPAPPSSPSGGGGPTPGRTPLQPSVPPTAGTTVPTPPAKGGPKSPGAPTATPPAPKPKPGLSANPSIPYRVTIRLPQADPSAPAEAVTQALRAASIPFEVETIERVKGAAAPVEAPSVRQAPPPR